MSIELVMPSNHLILCCSFFPLPLVFPSIRVFSNELALHIRQSKYWSLSFSISPPNEYSGLISFRIDWSDLLAVQATLQSLLQRYNLKASILWSSTFFIVQLLYLYMTMGKTIALTIQMFLGKCLYFLICCLGWSQFSFKRERLFSFHGCSHHLHLFWNPRKESLSLSPLFPHIFAMK